MTKAMFAVAYLALLASPEAYADEDRNLNHAIPATCLFAVEGKAFISGKCEQSLTDEMGSFTISDNKFFLSLEMDGDRAKGYWNGSNAESHAHDSLGSMSRKGDCWINKSAVVCVFKNPQLPLQSHSYCGILKNYGDAYQIVDGIYDVYLPQDNQAPADPKRIVKTIIAKKLVNNCVCIGGIADSFDRGGDLAYAFKQIDNLKSCKTIIR